MHLKPTDFVRYHQISAMGDDVMQFIPGEELAIDRKARVRIPSVEQGARTASERTADFDDTFLPLSEAEARQAA